MSTSIRPHKSIALAALLVLLIALFATPAVVASQPPVEIRFKDYCWSNTTSKSTGNVSQDLATDYELHNQTDSAGGKLEVWCINNAYYAVFYVDSSGVRHFIGKCPFDGGLNRGNKTHTDSGAMENITWESRDTGSDDDHDGRDDKVRYFFNVTSGNLTVQHHNGSNVTEKVMRPATGPVRVGDLPPWDHTSDDFWAILVPTTPTGGRMGPDGGFSVAALRVTVTDGGHPAAGRAVAVRLAGEEIAAGTTDAAGEAEFVLDTGHAYSVLVAGSSPVEVLFMEPTHQTVVISQPAATQRFLPGMGAPILLVSLVVAAACLPRRTR